jgi:hypothetical protein
MKSVKLALGILLALGMALGARFSPFSHADQSLDAGKLDQILGLKGTVKAGEYKVSIPQRDINVKVDGFRITPPMGLTTWVGFSPTQDGAMVMGDIVLTEDEVGPVEKTAIDQGLNVTGLHNHFVRDDRKVMYMHIGGMGPTEKMAKSVRAVLDKVNQSRRTNPAEGKSEPVKNEINTAKIESILGQKGETSEGVLKFVIGRPDVKLTDHGMPVSSFMGFNTWAAFQGTEDKAAVAGDFTMLDREVEPVIRALVEHGIEVVAVHNHMVTENPRIFFLHYWGNGPADKLAEGLKAAIAQTGKTAG